MVCLEFRHCGVSGFSRKSKARDKEHRSKSHTHGNDSRKYTSEQPCKVLSGLRQSSATDMIRSVETHSAVCGTRPAEFFNGRNVYRCTSSLCVTYSAASNSTWRLPWQKRIRQKPQAHPQQRPQRHPPTLALNPSSGLLPTNSAAPWTPANTST